MIRLTIAAMALLLAGCAAHPRSITSMAVSDQPYKGLSCPELRHELSVAVDRRDTFIRKQKGNRTRDGLLNALLIPGLGAVTSDHEDEVAEAKGRVEAIERVIATNCT